MSFPPVQGSSAAASRREIPTFGLPKRNPRGSTWGGDDRGDGVAAIAAARRPTIHSGFSGRTSFGKWWSRRKTRRGTRS